MKKILLLILLLLIPVGYGSATVEEVDIINAFPDEESTERATQIVGRFQSDSTTTFTANVYVIKPDMNIVKNGARTLTVKSGAPRETAFTIEENIFNEFGTYKVILNQTDNNVNDTYNFTITPRPIVDIRLGDLVKDPAEPNLDYVTVNVNPVIGRSLARDDFVNPNFTVYRITEDTTTPRGVPKEQVFTTAMGISNETGDLEASFDVTDFPEGSYKAVVTFNITSCAMCPQFAEVEATSFRIRDNAINAMTAAIGVILSLIFSGFLLAYIALNLDPTNKIIAVLRVFLLMAAPLFIPVAAMTAGVFATESGFTAVGEYMNAVTLGTFFLWFVYLFVLGVLFYMDQSVKAFLGMKEYDPDI